MKISLDNSPKEHKFTLRRKLFLTLMIILLTFLFFPADRAFVVSAQTKDRQEKIIKKVTFENEPIEFVGLESDRDE